MNYLDIIATDLWHITGGGPQNEDMKELFRVYAVLALVKGVETTLEDVHDAWSTWAAKHDPEHRDLVPASFLPLEVRMLDQPYLDAIRQVARRLPPRGAVVIRTEVV